MHMTDATTAAASVFSKVQRRVMPLLILTWFVAYIDRFNVSFAALQMNDDLGLSSAVFGFGAGVFFLGYAVFEIPSNMILARIGPRVWLARIMVTWGLLSAAMIFTQGPVSFYVLRFLLGVAEAGCFPGMAYYLTRWLDERQRAAALASLATMAMVSGVAGAPMAAALLSLDGAMGLAGWQWLFLVEGLPAVVLGWVVFRFLPDGPETASWLTAAEREWIASHVTEKPAAAHGRGAIATVLADRRYWVWGMSFFCATAAGSALRLFQPTILREVTGYGAVMSALLTAVPSLVGVLAILYVGRRSARLDERRWHAAVPMFVGGLGLVLVGVTYGVVGALIVGSIATIGVASQPPLFASVSGAATGVTNAAGIAFVNSVAAVGAFVGPYVVGYAFDQTASLAIVCAAAGLVMSIGGVVLLTGTASRVAVPQAIAPRSATV
jgi:MFS transporter, ACS family, tartrate transporter